MAKNCPYCGQRMGMLQSGHPLDVLQQREVRRMPGYTRRQKVREAEEMRQELLRRKKK